jgi:hypothetical protein
MIRIKPSDMAPSFSPGDRRAHVFAGQPAKQSIFHTTAPQIGQRGVLRLFPLAPREGTGGRRSYFGCSFSAAELMQ